MGYKIYINKKTLKESAIRLLAEFDALPPDTDWAISSWRDEYYELTQKAINGEIDEPLDSNDLPNSGHFAIEGGFADHPNIESVIAQFCIELKGETEFCEELGRRLEQRKKEEARKKNQSPE